MSYLLDHITSYDEIRVCVGMSAAELPDNNIERLVYNLDLKKTLKSISGVYGGVPEVRNLDQIFTDETAGLEEGETTEMSELIQLLSIYRVSELISRTISMGAPKTRSDGKGSITRFSPEATFKEVISSCQDNYSAVLQEIKEKFSDYSKTEVTIMGVVTPATNLVTGA